MQRQIATIYSQTRRNNH